MTTAEALRAALALIEDKRLAFECAVIWHAHDAEVSLERSRQTLLEERDAQHSGDCINMPWTCMRCVADDSFKAGLELRAAVMECYRDAIWRAEAQP